MIAEIFPPSASFSGAVQYNFKKLNENHAAVIAANLIIPDSTGKYSPSKIIGIFERMAALSSRTKNPVFHCSLNPVPGEVLSDEMYEKIAAEYMKNLGYGDQPYIVIRHNDISREHIHIISCRVNSRGKKINDSMERKRSQRIIFDIVKKYGLLEYEMKNDRRKRLAEVFSPDRGNSVEQVRNVLSYLYASFRFHSIGDLAFLLKKYNIDLVTFEKEEKGRKYPGVMFFGTDGSGNRLTTQILTSDLGRGYGYTAVQNRIAKNIQRSEPLFLQLRSDIADAVSESRGNLDDFILRMKERGTDVTLKRTADGSRIYGITFHSDDARFVVSGSVLGKDFSAAGILRMLQKEEESRKLDLRQKQPDTESISEMPQMEPKVQPVPAVLQPEPSVEEAVESESIEDDEDRTINVSQSHGGSNDAEYRKRARLFRKGNKFKI